MPLSPIYEFWDSTLYRTEGGPQWTMFTCVYASTLGPPDLAIYALAEADGSSDASAVAVRTAYVPPPPSALSLRYQWFDTTMRYQASGAQWATFTHLFASASKDILIFNGTISGTSGILGTLIAADNKLFGTSSVQGSARVTRTVSGAIRASSVLGASGSVIHCAWAYTEGDSDVSALPPYWSQRALGYVNCASIADGTLSELLTGTATLSGASSTYAMPNTNVVCAEASSIDDLSTLTGSCGFLVSATGGLGGATHFLADTKVVFPAQAYILQGTALIGNALGSETATCRATSYSITTGRAAPTIRPASGTLAGTSTARYQEPPTDATALIEGFTDLTGTATGQVPVTGRIWCASALLAGNVQRDKPGSFVSAGRSGLRAKAVQIKGVRGLAFSASRLKAAA